VLKAGERLEEAVGAYREAVAARPDYAEAYNNLGVLLLVIGETDEARACFDKAIELDPRCIPAWENLSHARSFGPEDTALFERLSGLIDDTDLSNSELASVHFALGKMYDDRRSYERAFSHYDEGNRLKALSCHFSRTDFGDYVSQIIEAFPGEVFERSRTIGHPSELPVFIIGMPRSGTTLAEQILASHPAVYGADELDYMDKTVTRLNELTQPRCEFPENIAALGDNTLAGIARDYVRGLQNLSPSAIRVSDKGLRNFLYLGLIALLLPGARVVDCQRDARDVCLSNYFQNYTKGLNFSYRLSDLAFYSAQYQRLWSHWREVVSLPVYRLEYERLVADMPGVSRELVEFCGLPWSERCLSFHSSKRRVKTASHRQVRQPIYASSVQRWRHYETQLGSLLSALAQSSP
jgi:hypothetical protein